MEFWILFLRIRFEETLLHDLFLHILPIKINISRYNPALINLLIGNMNIQKPHIQYYRSAFRCAAFTFSICTHTLELFLTFTNYVSLYYSAYWHFSAIYKKSEVNVLYRKRRFLKLQILNNIGTLIFEIQWTLHSFTCLHITRCYMLCYIAYIFCSSGNRKCRRLRICQRSH